MVYIANEPNVYEDEEELTRLLREAGFKVFTGATVERRIQRKKILVDLKGGKCERCGYKKNMSALDFHHPGAKSFQISPALHEFTNEQFEEILIPEVKNRTILLCANCHREEHHKNS